MEELSRLANTNPSNPTGDPAANANLNQAFWQDIAGVQSGLQAGGAKVDKALGGWPGRIGDYMGDLEASPEGKMAMQVLPLAMTGTHLPGTFPSLSTLGKGEATGIMNDFSGMSQLMQNRPDLKEWYNAAKTPQAKQDILNFINKTYLGK